MSQVAQHTLDAVSPLGNGLRVEFYCMGPRWAHRLLAVEGQVSLPLLESVEGDEEQAFPPSPALQQLAFQELPNGVIAALLVGMAGKNHWSVGVEADPAGARIRFDVACRNQPCRVGILGSVYKPLIPWSLTTAGLPAAETEGFHYDLVPELIERTNRSAWSSPPAGPVKLQVEVDRAARTQRWCYEFRQSEC